MGEEVLFFFFFNVKVNLTTSVTIFSFLHFKLCEHVHGVVCVCVCAYVWGGPKIDAECLCLISLSAPAFKTGSLIELKRLVVQ